MTDLSKLSDSDLEAMAKGDLSKISDEGLQHLHDSMAPSLGKRVMNAALAVPSAIDSFTGVPTRAAIYAAQTGGNPLAEGLAHIGAKPEESPTGKMIAAHAGVSDNPILSSQEARDAAASIAKASPMGRLISAILPESAKERLLNTSPADLAGVGVDVAANPLNVLPMAGSAMKGVGAVGKALEAAGGVGEPIGTGIQVASELPGYAAKKAAEIVTGIPKKAIETYAGRGGEVKDLLTKYGGEMAPIADEMKGKVLDSIKTTKQGLADEITKSLATADPNKVVPTQPILEKLAKAKSDLNAHYNPGDISQIDEMMDAINSNSPNGTMNLKDLFETKNFLQSRANGSFVKNGDLFISGDKASKAANDARKIAVDALHAQAPEIKHADSIYSDLHDIDNKMSVSLLGQGKPESVFASAGGGKGNIHQTMLRRIGEVTGTDPVKDAELMYAAKNFREPDLRGTALRSILDLKRGYNALPVQGLTNTGNALPSNSDFSNMLDLMRQPTEDNAINRRLKNGK